jgi:hypothetical protein
MPRPDWPEAGRDAHGVIEEQLGPDQRLLRRIELPVNLSGAMNDQEDTTRQEHHHREGGQDYG